MYAFHPQFERLLDMIKSNILGEINYAYSMFSFPIQPARHYRINRPIKLGGGALWDIGTYAIHTLRQCFKENPLRVYAQSKLNEQGADLSTTGMIDFGQNKRATFDISFECTRRSEVEVFGPSGRAKIPTIWQPEDQKAKVTYSTEKSGFHEEIVPKASHFELEFKHFNECILKNTSPKLSSQDALWNVKTLEALQKSVETNAWVSL
jgi:xylose dehydrogenase (NAD/NADP)